MTTIKDTFTTETHGGKLGNAMFPKMAAPHVPRGSLQEIKKVPNTNPPSWSNGCSNEMWGGNLDTNMDGSLSSYSLDPVLRNFYNKKEEILTEVLGWATCQAPDGLRPMLLVALQAKRMLELVEYIKCAEKILSNIRKTVYNMTTGLTNAINTMTVYANTQASLLAQLELEFMNMPNAVAQAAMTGMILNFNSYINDLTSATGNTPAFIAALSRLASTLNATLQTLEKAQAIATQAGASTMVNLKNFAESAKTLTDPAAIAEAKGTLTLKYGWMASTSPTIYGGAMNATPATWYGATKQMSDYASEQVALAQADSSSTAAREAMLDALQSAQALPANDFLAIATEEEATAYNSYVLGNAEEKPSRALVLINLIDSILAAEAITSDERPKQIATVKSLIDTINQYFDTQDSIAKTQAQIDGLKLKQQELEARLIAVDQIDLSKEIDQLLSVQSAAFQMTVTNDTNMFENFDGVTTYDLVRRLSNWPINQWYDVFNSNAVGTLVASGANMIVLHVAKKAFLLNQDQSLGIRVLINNGLWILDCYSNGDSSRNEVTEESVYTTAYGRFSSVPTTPNPDSYMPMTYEQWKVAANNSAVATADRDGNYVIVDPPTIPNLLTTTYHAGNPATGGAWLRLLTQQEIWEREQDYLEVLQMLNLSAISENISSHGRNYSLAGDTQVRDLLLHKKPYSNMQIPIKSISLQFAKISSSKSMFENIDLVPSTTLPFSFAASWGFVPKL